MPVSFEQLIIGQSYDRPYLADIWGYKGFQAISRGMVTPATTNYIILFVTKENQKGLTQYNDYLDGDLLHWEGEKNILQIAELLMPNRQMMKYTFFIEIFIIHHLFTTA